MNSAIAVVGGGPAGMMAACAIAQAGGQAVLYEQNAACGKKLRITGKGRCNVTNDCTPAQVMENITRNRKFLYSALYRFSPADVMAFFEEQGVPLKTERGRRVFPVSDRAADICAALERLMARLHCSVIREQVQSVLYDTDNNVCGLRTRSGREYAHGAVIIATGGISYPATGSRGDGHRMAGEAGLHVTPLTGSLVPIVCRESTRDWMGLSPKNVRLTVKRGDKTVFAEQGEMLFTHFGVSGPLVLSASAHMQEGDITDYRMSIGWKPALSEEELDARLVADMKKYAAKDFINSLGDLLPRAMIPAVVERSGIPPRMKAGAITREMRGRLLSVLKEFTLTPVAFRPVEEAIVTCGGVDVKEIDPKTMMARRVPGLFFAGEVLDLDAYTGGYNLQIAWSTGRQAGLGAAQYILERTIPQVATPPCPRRCCASPTQGGL